MARGKSAARKRKPIDLRIAPTIEAQIHGQYESAGMAYKRIPTIDTMLARKQITNDEHGALAFYRNQVDTSEKSPVRDSLNFERGSGSGNTLSAAVVSAILATSRIERDMGQLRDVARAIAVDDMSLSAWCIHKHGGRERYDGDGRFIAVVPVREVQNMRIALLELKMASHRIVR
jgi:hypothetical protein